MAEWLIYQLKDVHPLWQVFFLSMLPVTELRLAVPIGIALGLSPLSVLLVALAGNFVPVIPLLCLLEPWSRWLSRYSFFERLLAVLFKRTRQKGEKIQKYGSLGLLLFVGIPAPGTGVWTGCLLAFLLGIRFRYAFPAIVGGMVLAGLVVVVASVGAFKLAAYNIWLLLGVVAGVIMVVVLSGRRR
ncbi:COG2426 family protein [Calderihabitans maritimus]|uniref:Putative small multi-drug export protein n=1 Tax=Calderihabitans maritimus TaxID=1246530 RepID=A0A1Z5HU56_9FIRM|nr:small multi-drug export protein [Calderihabitans maritimus]GAW93063.1 putative small multi-drug export protein [Calderihabitans maritimus]